MRVMSLLVDAVLGALVAGVLVLEDIDAGETATLHGLMDSMRLRLPNILPRPSDSGTGVNPWERVPTYAKFVQVAAALQMGLVDLTQAWQTSRGALTADEMRGLVRALFMNSDLRASCLAQIK